jgi:tRNA G18 (ribose-2'-O)-methylase SpoU
MDWHIISDARALRAAGLFVAEGRRVVERVLRDGRFEVVSLLATDAAAVALDLTDREVAALDVRSPTEVQSLTGFNFHRGLLALVRRPVLPAPAALLTTLPVGSRIVVCERLADADNVGSVFRNARALGATAVLLDDRCVDPLYRKAVRTSAGAVLEIPWTVATMSVLLDALRDRAIVPVVLTPDASAPAIGDVARQLGTAHAAVVLGNEGEGVSVATRAACQHVARIPMAEGADSLNVATALAVALYALRPGRTGAGTDQPPPRLRRSAEAVAKAEVPALQVGTTRTARGRPGGQRAGPRCR